MSSHRLLERLTSAVEQSPLPALLIELPSTCIVAGSSAAMTVLEPAGGREILGKTLDEVTLDEGPGALPLLMSGRLQGLETTRVLDAAGKPMPITIWVRRAVDAVPPAFVVAIIASTSPASRLTLPSKTEESEPRALGAVGPNLVITRICTDAEAAFGLPTAQLVGRSMLELVTPASVNTLMTALQQASITGRGVPTQADLVRGDGSTLPVQLLVTPLQDPHGSAFSVAPGAASSNDVAPHEIVELLTHLAHGIDALKTSHALGGQVAEAQLDSLSKLSSRESVIVSRLLAGDRVPAISRDLFLSQSTVRNHLSSVFAKLHVGSQQELLDLLRGRGKPSTPR